MHMINNKKIKELINKYYLNILVFIIIAVNLVRIIPIYYNLSDFWRSYILNYYTLSYQTAGGFVSRGFVGTIVNFFTESINSKIFYLIFWLIYLVSYNSIAAIFLKYVKKSEKKSLYFAFFLLILFNPATMNYACDFARPDIFLVYIAIVCMYLIARSKFLFLVPFLVVIGMLIHEGFICFFMPIIGIAFLISCTRKKKIFPVIWFAVTIILCLLTLVLVFKYGKTNVTDVDRLFELMQNKIDIGLNSNMVNFEFGEMKQDLWSISFNELSAYTTWLELIFYAVIFLPIYYIYFKVVGGNSYIVSNVFLRILNIIAPFSGLLMIIVGVDYGRWFSLSITACCIHLFYFVMTYDIDIFESLKIQDIGKALTTFFSIVLVYMAIGPMGDIHEHFDFLVSLNNLVTLFWQ